MQPPCNSSDTLKDNKSDCVVDTATPNCSNRLPLSSLPYTPATAATSVAFPATYSFSYTAEIFIRLLVPEWEGSEGSIGAKEATAGLSDAVYKRFNGVERREAAYEECQMTGVLAALKNKMDNERFFVIKGSNLVSTLAELL
ncbi:hypothetical protein BDP27DRAFT_1429880 [Rhodocollybia butyracea]|uniref:Uncharacterized protein n=1 Tax=Rhodocollybia butyracea TaxID=206335 RepID=A0A9P5PD94_9AGAR|nr:hypothetical protein BDP27DRAFT_1429880 [Rhodocollybia butyracea]